MESIAIMPPEPTWTEILQNLLLRGESVNGALRRERIVAIWLLEIVYSIKLLQVHGTMERAVVIVHGLKWLHVFFRTLEKRLETEGYHHVFLRYSPRVDGVQGATEKLVQEVNELEGHEVNFITHSMGGLILRAFGAMNHKNITFGRAVMIAPPNRGALMMKKLRSFAPSNAWCSIAFGKAARDLMPGDEGLADRLPPPPCEYGIIAGGTSSNSGYTPFLPGDNDGTVTVETTQLDGANDYMLLPHLHTPLLWSNDVIDAVLRFLDNGTFEKKP